MKTRTRRTLVWISLSPHNKKILSISQTLEEMKENIDKFDYVKVKV